MPVDDAQVTSALSQSRAAHLAYRQALANNNAAAARTALQSALDLRVSANDLDPQHSSIAWALDPYTKLHSDLLAFYRQQLAK